MDTLLFQQNIDLIHSCHPPHYRHKPYDTHAGNDRESLHIVHFSHLYRTIKSKKTVSTGVHT